MLEVTCRTTWSWTVVNDQDQPCHVIEDLMVHAKCQVEEGNISDLVVTHVEGDFAERVGVSWRHQDRALPQWLATEAVKAAQRDAGNSSGLLYEGLQEDALEQAKELEDEDEDPDRDEED